jgi:hypothetical protein
MASRFGVPLIGMHACKYLMIHLLVEMHASVLACNECHLAAYTPASYDTCYNRVNIVDICNFKLGSSRTAPQNTLVTRLEFTA